MNESLIIVFQLIVLLFSVIVHEVSHGIAALRLGDQTAKQAGRLTLNPIKHLDPIGSFLFPITLLIIQSPILLGWAKPVPYNPNNLKNPKKGAGIIAAAGPLSNFIIAAVFGIILRVMSGISTTGDVSPLMLLFNSIVLTNVLLAIFNLLPIPPLDGSGVLFSLLPYRYRAAEIFLTRYGFIILILFIMGGSRFLEPIIATVYRFIAGPGALF